MSTNEPAAASAERERCAKRRPKRVAIASSAVIAAAVALLKRTSYEPLPGEGSASPWCPACHGTGTLEHVHGPHETIDVCDCSDVEADEDGSFLHVRGIACAECLGPVHCDTGRMRLRDGRRDPVCGDCVPVSP